MEPMSLIMLLLLAVLVFFMFRNSKKRRQQAEELQNSLVPGAEVMLTSGIFGTVVEIEEGEERAKVRVGDNVIEVHRQAIARVVTPVTVPETADEVAPDDDPRFGTNDPEFGTNEPEFGSNEPELGTNAEEGDKPKS